MKWTTTHRMLLALAASVVANVLLLSTSSRIADKIFDGLIAPLARTMTFLGWSPSIHDGGLLAMLPLVVLYVAALIWVIISVPVWWRRRA